MSKDLIQLDVRRPTTKVVTIVAILLASIWALFAFRWYLGNTLAEYFNTQLNDVEMAKLAVALAPSDPLTHWRLGQVYQQKLPLDQQQLVISEFQAAVKLSPNDYRFWTALGTAYEQLGDATQAERALRQAVALAPAYARPHWYLGNLFLRHGRYDEAFAELRFAANADPELRHQLFSLVLQVHGNDLQAMRRAIGESPTVLADFAAYLLEQKRIDDGLIIWNSLDEHAKRQNRSSGSSLITTLIGEKRFHDAMNVWNSMGPGQETQVEIARIIDGSFGSALMHGSEMVFGWHVSAAPQMQVGLDPNKGHWDSRSLRLIFKARTKLDSINVSQLLLVDAATQYDFQFYVKTDKLETGSSPFVQIVDASDGAVLATSSAAPTGDSDWSPVEFSFKTGTKTEAVTVRLARDPCGEEQVCPIFGSVWYDDFSIKRSD
jgi:hypothetical protein